MLSLLVTCINGHSFILNVCLGTRGTNPWTILAEIMEIFFVHLGSSALMVTFAYFYVFIPMMLVIELAKRQRRY
jgi:hypothetical protein